VISPLLANVYIHRLLRAWKQFGLESRFQARIINYADDLVIVSRGRAKEALAWLRWIIERLGLCLFKQSLREVLHRGNQAPLKEVLEQVNRKLRGWSQYFSIGSLQRACRIVDQYTRTLPRTFLVQRHKVPGRGTRRFSEAYLYEESGLMRLTSRRPVSRSYALA